MLAQIYWTIYERTHQLGDANLGTCSPQHKRQNKYVPSLMEINEEVHWNFCTFLFIKCVVCPICDRGSLFILFCQFNLVFFTILWFCHRRQIPLFMLTIVIHNKLNCYHFVMFVFLRQLNVAHFLIRLKKVWYNYFNTITTIKQL